MHVKLILGRLSFDVLTPLSLMPSLAVLFLSPLSNPVFYLTCEGRTCVRRTTMAHAHGTQRSHDWWGRWDLNPRPLAPRLVFLRDASAPGSPRAHALWYPVGGIVFPDQGVQRVLGISSRRRPRSAQRRLRAHNNFSLQVECLENALETLDRSFLLVSTKSLQNVSFAQKDS